MHVRIAGAALAALLAAACGGGSDTAQPEPAADSGDSPPRLKMGGSGPDPALAQERLLLNANMAVPDAAKLLSYTETGVRYEGPPEMQAAIVSYEAELEFTADTYFHTDHKAGDRAKVSGEVEYLNEGGNWRIIQMGIYPR
ncbi:MAG: hypothetical protein ACT4UQ_06070 [Gammaproteobacteria bacterium]